MKLRDRSARRLILAAAAGGLVLRAAFGLFYWLDKPLTHDEREYLALARSLTQGRGFTYDESEDVGTGQRFGRAPGYPAFLALIGAGRASLEHETPLAADEPARDGRLAATPNSTPAVVKIAQAFVGAATVWLIGLIALRAAGPRTGVVAAAIAAVYPSLVAICAYVLSETLYSALALMTAHTLQIAAGNGNQGGARKVTLMLATGALAGCAILVRPAMLLFLPFAVIWLTCRRRTWHAVVLVAATAAVVAPWTLRNARVHGRFVLVASEGGVTFWTGNHPLARGEGDLAANPALKQAELEFRRAHPGLTSEELEPLYYRDAFASIAAQPWRWMGLIARKAFYTIVPIGPSYRLHSTRYRAASVIPYLLVLPAAIIGMRRLWQSVRRPTAVLLLGASAVLVGLVFFPQERFRIPVIDPVLIIAAAANAAHPTRDNAL